MSKIRISVPLYRRTLFEDGWRGQPLPTDIPQETINLRVFDVPWGRDKHQYMGWQVSPTPVDVIPQDDLYTRQWTDLTEGRNKHQYWIWEQRPLAADNSLAAKLSETEVPLSRDKHSYTGWQQQPLADDNDLSTARTWGEVTAGKDKHIYVGWQTQPLAAPNEEAAARFHDLVPELGKWPLRFTYEGWWQQPLAADIPQETISQLFEVPKGLDRHVDTTWFAQPLSDDFVQPLSSAHETFDVPLSRDKNQYGGFQLPIVVDDNDLAVFHIESLVPLSLDKNTYEGWQQGTVPPDAEGAIPKGEFDNPLADTFFDVHNFDGFTRTPPLPDNDPSASDEWTTVPWGRDRHFYQGAQQSPLPAPNEMAGARTEVEVPLARDQHSYVGWQQGPLSAPNEPATHRDEFEVPQSLDRNSYSGFTLSPPPFVTVEETMPLPTFAVPAGRVPEFELYAGPIVSPTPEDVIPVVSESTYRPIWRPRRR